MVTQKPVEMISEYGASTQLYMAKNSPKVYKRLSYSVTIGISWDNITTCQKINKNKPNYQIVSNKLSNKYYFLSDHSI